MTRVAWAALWLAAAVNVAGCASCADLSAPRPFPCEQSKNDAEQCAAGWRCGLEGKCFDAAPDAGRALTCADSARHCAQGWRCGAAAEDGRRRCQQEGVGGSYPCRENADCEGDWRCDPVVHVCSEVGDQLSASRLSAVTVDVVSPLLPLEQPSHAAVGHLQLAVPSGGAFPLRARVVGLVADGGVFVVTVLDSASFPTTRERVEVRRYPVDEGHLRELATAGIAVVGRFDDGRVLAWDRDQGDVVLFDGGVRGLAAIATEGGLAPGSFELVALGDRTFTFVRNTGERAAPIDLDAGRPIDVSGNLTDTWAMSEAGTARIGFGSGAPETIWTSPLTPAPLRYERLGLSNKELLVAQRLPDAGLGWAFLEPLPPHALRAGPCPVCPFGAEPQQVFLPAETELLVVVRCPPTPSGGLPVGRTWAVQMASGQACGLTRFQAVNEDEAPFAHGFVRGTGELRWRAHGGARGRAWYAEDGSPLQPQELAAQHPVVLDRMPILVTRLALGGKSSVAALAGTWSFEESAAGLVSQLRPNLPDDFSVLGAVAGAPNLVVTTEGVYNIAAFPLGSDVPQLVAALAPGAARLVAPASGSLLPLSSGRVLLVVSSDDTLLSADVTAQLSTDAGVDGTLLRPAVLAARLVPAPGVPVRDVALGETTSGNSGSRALGGFYVLARNEVFAIDVLDAETWRATPIPLPADFGAPRELWTEGGRGRVAFERGFISALPTPVQLAPPLSTDGSREARDFARLCGDTLAIVGTGVEHFVSDVGWVPVGGVTLTAAQAANARFFEAGPSTFLAADDGLVLELSPRKTDAGVPECPR